MDLYRQAASIAALKAGDIIRRLHLQPHPEGGHFRETFRDTRTDAAGRAVSTAIYYLLARGEQVFGNLPDLKPRRKVKRWVNLYLAEKLSQAVKSSRLYLTENEARANANIDAVAVAVEIEVDE